MCMGPLIRYRQSPHLSSVATSNAQVRFLRVAFWRNRDNRARVGLDLPVNGFVALRLEQAVDLGEVLAAKEARAVLECPVSGSWRRVRGFEDMMVGADDKSFLALGLSSPEAEDDA